MLSLTSLSGELCMRSDTQETCTPEKPDIIRKTLPLSALALGCCQTSVLSGVGTAEPFRDDSFRGQLHRTGKRNLAGEVAFAQDEQRMNIVFKR